MKKSNIPLRASHVNVGTSIPRQELPEKSHRGQVLRHPRLHFSTDSGVVTAYGGLTLAASLVRSLGLDRSLNRGLDLLRSHRPYTESDHVLTQVYNLFVGGTCIEDIANLQTSDAVRRILGAARIPDPTTAGDFLRRFDEQDLRDLNRIIDEAQGKVWRRRWGVKKQKLALIDVDSCVSRVYGNQKEGADFSYKGCFSYHPLVISLAGTQECLRLVNRPGNAPCSEGVEDRLRELFPLLKSRFRRVVVRGDSAFACQKLYDACEENDQYFALVNPAYPNLKDLAESLPERAWKPFRTREQRQRQSCPIPKSRRRRRKQNRRRQKARARKLRDLRLRKQWLTEIDYQPGPSKTAYRLIIRRQRIEERDGQGRLFDFWRYRYVITNIRDLPASEVVDLTYQRCDQENIIEQLQSGIAGLRMPTGNFLANDAHLTCARLAYNMKSWLGQICLPAEVVRWEWKRFRQSFVVIAATVVKKARQVQVRLARSHRFHREVISGCVRLQT